MSTRLAAVTALLAASSFLAAQPKPTTAFPCELTDYRIPLVNTIVVRCDGVRIENFVAAAELYKVLDESVVYRAVQSRARAGSGPAGDGFWLKFVFDKSFEPGRDYELRFSGNYKIERPPAVAPVTENFPATRFRFCTRPDLHVVKLRGQQAQKLSSHYAMSLSDGAVLVDHSNREAKYVLQLSSPDLDDYDAVGQILMDPAPTTPGQKLELRGIKDVFGQVPPPAPAKPAPPPAAPKSKDAASWYFNFLHQAGVGITPTWIANVKIAPVLGGLPAGFFITPSLNVDVGQGRVGQTKANDLINPKLGATRLVWWQRGILEAWRVTPSLSYETNRAGDKRNFLFDGDVRVYLKGLDNTQAERTQDAFLAARLKNPNTLPRDVPKARVGYSLQLLLGTEIGSALTDNAAKSSDESSQVTVPHYTIGRFRPHLSGTLEFWNFTVSVAVYPRYLFSAENVTREISTGGNSTIYVARVSGWRPYGECALNYAFDTAGHYAINTVYKLGSQPPNFDRVNVIQSGILVRF